MKKITLEILKQIRFGLIYRKLALNDHNINDLTYIEQEIYSSGNKISIDDVDKSLIMNELKNVLIHSESSQLLWLYRCIYDNNNCLLHSLSPYMRDISNITRGGLNIYKRLGWDIHVLYAYQLICDNYKANKSTGIIGATNDFFNYQQIWNDMDNECRFILKISTFLHDIGVIDGVKDHEVKGIKWVKQRFDEIGFNETDFSNIGVSLSKEEIYSILKFIVGSHQMINQIGSEISDSYVFEKIKRGQQSLHDYGLQFFESNIAKIMYLLSAADLMAVDDMLLTEEKIKETTESFEYFQLILKKGFFVRDFFKYGIQRFRSLLNDSIKIFFSNEIFEKITGDLGYNPMEIANFLYCIPQMSYAMTFVKPQKKYAVSLKMFCVIFEIFLQNNINPKTTNLKFDPDINSYELGKYLEVTSIDKVIKDKKLKLTYIENEQNMNINYEE